MSKEFFYNIAFRNVSGRNILQNKIALKPLLHHSLHKHMVRKLKAFSYWSYC